MEQSFALSLWKIDICKNHKGGSQIYLPLAILGLKHTYCLKHVMKAALNELHDNN